MVKEDGIWKLSIKEGDAIWGEAQETREKLAPTRRLGETFRLGNLEITPLKVELRRVKHEDGFLSSRVLETKQPLIVLTYAVRNVSEGQVFAPFAAATMKDNYGNELDDPEIRPVGSEEFQELKPGDQGTVILCFGPKIETATSYECVLYQKVDNQGSEYDLHLEPWILQFRAEEIAPH